VYLLRKALYGLKQSARCWNSDLDRALWLLGFTPVPTEPCFYVLWHDPRKAAPDAPHPPPQEGEHNKHPPAQEGEHTKHAAECTSQHDPLHDPLFDEFENLEFDLADLYPFSSITALLSTWVDDIVLTGPLPAILDYIFSALHHRFPLTDGRELAQILGIEIVKNQLGIFLSQRQYTDAVLTKFQHANCHPDQMPLDPSAIPTLMPRDDTATAAERARYQELTGSLNYLSIRTWPDISTAVAFLSRFNHNLAAEHWAALKRVLCYLRGTTNFGLLYPRQQPNALALCPYLVVYTDSDWAQSADRMSISRYVLQFGAQNTDHAAVVDIAPKRATINWRSGKQSCIARSSTEAEIIAASDAARDIAWIHQISEEILGTTAPIPLLMDNHGAIEIMHVLRKDVGPLERAFAFKDDEIGSADPRAVSPMVVFTAPHTPYWSFYGRDFNEKFWNPLKDRTRT
ncbi:MAG: hypothetical protein BJ554DRAFT_8328, partial [Olpidium bornovanus]